MDNNLNRVVAINANACMAINSKHHHKKSVLKTLYEDVFRAGVPIIKNFKQNNGCFLYKNDLDKFFEAFPDHPSRELYVPGSICPICGTMTPFGLFKDYRDNNGCIGSQISCVDCMYMDDWAHRRLRNMKDDEKKVKYVVDMITSNYSLTAQSILNDRIGFRTESYSGSQVRDLREVVNYEFSMGNVDIVDFCIKFHGANLETPLDDYDVLADWEYYENGICQVIKDSLGDPDDCEVLWLSTYENVEKRYLRDEEASIDQYSLPDIFIVLSDLGEDGILIAYRKDEPPLKQEFRFPV